MERLDSLLIQLRALEQGLAFARLEGVGLLRVVGPDRCEALHRVVSQDIRGIAAGDGRLALLLAPKGQFRALMAAFAAEDAIYLLAPPGKGEALATGLGKYLRFSRSRIESVPVARATALLGPEWSVVAAGLAAEPARLAGGGWSRGHGGDPLWFGQTLLGLPGAIVVSADPAVAGAVDEQLAATGAVRVSAHAVELERIRVGWPAWGAELTDTVLPPEVGVEKLAISYTKGCYVGQETIARLATYGHPNRTLVGLRELSGCGAAPAVPLELAGKEDAQRRGSLTSWALHPQLGGVGLALVRRELAAPGTILAGGRYTFEVAPIPLW
jgi:folate-binding protein YgfZ